MPTDLLFVWLHIEFKLYFVTIIFSYTFLDANELYSEYPF